MRKYNYPERVAAMRMLADGHSFNYVKKETGIDHFLLYRLWEKYTAGGELALLEDKPRRRTYEEKLLIMRDLVENGVSLKTVSLKYDICVVTLMRWRKKYIEKGPEGLVSQRKKMPKKKKTAAELDELERLRKRNEYLEAENALLKKVKALVEEREARLRAIGRGPSKN
jgi:transposase-like protein